MPIAQGVEKVVATLKERSIALKGLQTKQIQEKCWGTTRRGAQKSCKVSPETFSSPPEATVTISLWLTSSRQRYIENGWGEGARALDTRCRRGYQGRYHPPRKLQSTSSRQESAHHRMRYLTRSCSLLQSSQSASCLRKKKEE